MADLHPNLTPTIKELTYLLIRIIGLLMNYSPLSYPCISLQSTIPPYPLFPKVHPTIALVWLGLPMDIEYVDIVSEIPANREKMFFQAD